MDNHKATAPDGYVSESKYAELMTLYQAALSSAAEKEEQLMAEQALRNELVERLQRFQCHTSRGEMPHLERAEVWHLGC